MEFDRGGNAVGVEFGVRFRIVVNHDLAGLFLRTTGERFFAPALFASANVDLRRIGHQELHGLALGHLNHKPRLLSETIQTREYTLDARARSTLLIPGFWLRRNDAIRIQPLPRRILRGMNGSLALRFYTLEVRLALVGQTFAFGRLGIETVLLQRQP